LMDRIRILSSSSSIIGLVNQAEILMNKEIEKEKRNRG
jgi:hypothetical protein